jgi:Tfp pilus assembly protein PilV
MVALSILGIAVVALFQLFSLNLRSVKKSEDYSRALIHARSIMEQTYAMQKPPEISETFDFGDGFKGKRTVSLKSSDEEKAKIYEINVTVSWPPKGILTLNGLKEYHAAEE